jgi:hypothetical protein
MDLLEWVERLLDCLLEDVEGRSPEVRRRYRALLGYYAGWLRHEFRAKQLPEPLWRGPTRRLPDNRDALDAEAAAAWLEHPERAFDRAANARVRLFTEDRERNQFYWDDFHDLVDDHLAAHGLAAEILASLDRAAGQGRRPALQNNLTERQLRDDLDAVRASLATALGRVREVLRLGERDEMPLFQEELLLHWAFAELYDWHSQVVAQAYLCGRAGLIVPRGTVGVDLLRFGAAIRKCRDRLGIDQVG